MWGYMLGAWGVSLPGPGLDQVGMFPVWDTSEWLSGLLGLKEPAVRPFHFCHMEFF